MAQGPLVTEMIEAGGKLAAGFDQEYKPLSAAFWLKEGDEERWTLYLVSDQLDETNRTDGYREVRRLLSPLPHLWISDMQVKVYGVDHPVAKAVIEMMHEYPALLPYRTGTQMLNGQFIRDAYIYALPVTAA